MIDYLLNTLPNVHLYILGPGLVMCVFLAFKTFTNFVTFHWIKAATNLVYILIIMLFMAKYGTRIAEFLKLETSAPANEQTIEQNNN